MPARFALDKLDAITGLGSAASPQATEEPQIRSRAWNPRWVSRLRLRALTHRIARLEQALADEFAIEETEPMCREWAALVAERDALRQRLAERR